MIQYLYSSRARLLCYAAAKLSLEASGKEDDVAITLPKIQFGPKPRKWDLFAFAALILTAVLAAISWRTARAQLPGVSLSDSFTSAVVLMQLALCTISLLLLGKTATEGTLWGNLAAVGGMAAGLSGVLLAAALWVAA